MKYIVFPVWLPKVWRIWHKMLGVYSYKNIYSNPDTTVDKTLCTLNPLTEQPSNKPGLSWSMLSAENTGMSIFQYSGEDIWNGQPYWTRPYIGVTDEIHFTIYMSCTQWKQNLRFKYISHNQ